MFRILTLVAGLAGAAGLSQFPEFSQQYLQRLAGRVDELAVFVADFDASAEGVGLSRDQALDALTGGPFQEARQTDMRATIARYDRLGADLAALRGASVVQRVLQPQRFTDPEIAQAAWQDFKPAVPVTATGLGFAAAGFVAGGGVLAFVLALLRWPFRRLRRQRAERRANRDVRGAVAAARAEPVLRGGRSATPALPIDYLTRTSAAPHKVVAVGQGFQVATVSVEPGGSLSGQGASGGDVVLVCRDGAGVLRHDGQARGLCAGELALVPPGVMWELVNDGDAAMRLFCVEPRSGLAARGEALPSAEAPRLTAPVVPAR